MIGLLSVSFALRHMVAQDNEPPTQLKAPPPRVQDPTPPGKVELPQSPDTKPLGRLTAKEAAKIALQVQPLIKSAKGLTTTAKGRVQQSGAGLNPQLVMSAGYDSLTSLSGGSATSAPTGTTPPGVSPTFAYSSALGVRQLVFDYNYTRNLVRQNEALSDAAMANLDRAQQDVVNDVETNFYGYLNARRLEEVSERNLENRQRQLDLANARLKNGVGQPVDVVTAETSKSQAVLALTIARDTALQARGKLLLSMGVDPTTSLEIDDAEEETVDASDPIKLTDEGLKRRPEVRVAQLNVMASVFGVSAAKSTNMPSIVATLATGTLGQDVSASKGTLSFGIGVQIPISDGGARRGAVKTASGQLATAQADLETITLKVKTDIASAYLGLMSAEQRVPIADAQVANAREAVRIAEGRYAAGLGSFQDITTAQGLLVTAQQDQTTTQTNLNLARVKLKYATGQIR